MATLVGEKIRGLRKARGLTLEQLALAADTDTGGLSKLERGVQGYSDGMIQRIARALGVPVSELFKDMSNVDMATIGSRPVPILDYVQAGVWTSVNTEAEASPSEYLLTDLTLGTRAFAMRIRGESMLQRFKENDVVIIDPDETPHPGDFVVARNGGDEAIFKQYRLRGVNERGQEIFELLSLNKLFPSLRSDVTPMRIVGTMVEHRTYRRK